jgi:formate dehydrogenase assembly factor FdhD
MVIRDFFTIPNQNVQNENDADSDTNLTHKQLDQKTIKATNCSICITGDIEQLKQMEDFLIENNKIVAMRGQIQQFKSIEQKTYLQIMQKNKNQVPNLAIYTI